MAHFAVALLIVAIAPCASQRAAHFGEGVGAGGFGGPPSRNFEIPHLKWCVFPVILGINTTLDKK